jgi:hypothetical protein
MRLYRVAPLSMPVIECTDKRIAGFRHLCDRTVRSLRASGWHPANLDPDLPVTSGGYAVAEMSRRLPASIHGLNQALPEINQDFRALP